MCSDCRSLTETDARRIALDIFFSSYCSIIVFRGLKEGDAATTDDDALLCNSDMLPVMLWLLLT